MDKEELRQENIKKEITKNTIDFLIWKFEHLLLGLDTELYKFKGKEKERCILSIRNFIDYRIKEKIIDDKKLWNLLIEINKSKLDTFKEVERIFSKLFNISNGKSQAYSRYYAAKRKEAFIKQREESIKQAEKALKECLKRWK